ncbi:MAG: hypothetical protein H6831_15835 [Planctomycetes bacterium]|nr:hypothetical protein [Planctomycetota bacterium]MCB9905870.1 hypothetical protein [Planctomycetota bacterium]
MQSFQREEGRPAASASFLWEDAESGDRLRVSILVQDHAHEDFFADLERTGFRRIRAAELGETKGEAEAGEMPARNARRSSQAGPRVEEDGGTLPCSIDITSAFHASANERQLDARTAADEESGPVRRESA